MGHLRGCEHAPPPPPPESRAVRGGRGKRGAAVTGGGRREGDKFPAQRKNPDQKGCPKAQRFINGNKFCT